MSKNTTSTSHGCRSVGPTADDVTDDRIEALRYEAATHGDGAMTTICDRALEGDENARGQVLRALVDAWAAS